MKNRKPDEWIVERLKSTDDQANTVALRYLYTRMYDQINRFVLQNKGNREDGEDIFQEGLVVLFKLIKQNKFPEGYNVEAYLHSICRNLWLKRLHKYRREVELKAERTEIPMEDPGILHFLNADQRQAIDALFQQLGPDCRQVLHFFYYEKRSMKEIRELMGYGSDQVAKNKKSNCMKRLIALVNQSREDYKKLFTNEG